MLLQGMCDHEGLFSDIFVGFPGSVHDARVYQHSSIGRLGRVVIPTPYYVLADAAYPLSAYCLTPYRSHAEFIHSESNYNKRHAKSRLSMSFHSSFCAVRWLMINENLIDFSLCVLCCCSVLLCCAVAVLG